jgi:hypothetical protein
MEKYSFREEDKKIPSNLQHHYKKGLKGFIKNMRKIMKKEEQ